MSLKGFALLKMMVAKNHRKPQSVIDVIPFFDSARILKEKLSVTDSINSIHNRFRKSEVHRLACIQLGTLVSSLPLAHH